MKTKAELIVAFVYAKEKNEALKLQLEASNKETGILSNLVVNDADIMKAVHAGGIECEFGKLLTYSTQYNELVIKDVVNSFHFDSLIKEVK